MTADQPGPAPRRLASPESAGTAPTSEPGLDGLERPDGAVAQPGLNGLEQPVGVSYRSGAGVPRQTAAIATLEAPPMAVVGVPDDPRTGEPRVPRTVILASVFSFLAVANVAVGLLRIYWNAVPKENFAKASWLMGQFVTEPGSTGRVLLAIAVTVIALLIAVPLAITGYYAWAGYRWTRVSGVIAAVLSFGTLTLNMDAWSAIPLAIAAAVLLWLPPASRYFLAWHARRHPQPVFAPPTMDVFYGPLPRYRTDGR